MSGKREKFLCLEGVVWLLIIVYKQELLITMDFIIPLTQLSPHLGSKKLENCKKNI